MIGLDKSKTDGSNAVGVMFSGGWGRIAPR